MPAAEPVDDVAALAAQHEHDSERARRRGRSDRKEILDAPGQHMVGRDDDGSGQERDGDEERWNPAHPCIAAISSGSTVPD